MKKLEAIIRPHLLEKVKNALQMLGVQGMTISEVRGFGRNKGRIEIYRGSQYIVESVTKVKIEVVVDDDLIEYAIDVVFKAARTGKHGDGKIFVLPVDDAACILSGEFGVSAIY